MTAASPLVFVSSDLILPAVVCCRECWPCPQIVPRTFEGGVSGRRDERVLLLQLQLSGVGMEMLGGLRQGGWADRCPTLIIPASERFARPFNIDDRPKGLNCSSSTIHFHNKEGLREPATARHVRGSTMSQHPCRPGGGASAYFVLDPWKLDISNFRYLM